MRDHFVNAANAEVELVEASGGVFEVTIDGELRFSKKAIYRFPNDAELEAMTA